MKCARSILVAFVVSVASPPVIAAETVAPEPEVVQAPPSGSAPAPHAQGKAMPSDARTLIGIDVFSQDQTRVGSVEKVVSGPDGAMQAIHIKTGGFLGFGGKLVAIPQGKFAMRGQNVQLLLTSDEVAHLPAVKDQM